MHPSQPTGDVRRPAGGRPRGAKLPEGPATSSTTTERQVGDLVQINRADPNGGDSFTGTGQVLEVLPADEKNPVRYRVALVQLVHVPLTDDDLVDDGDRGQ